MKDFGIEWVYLVAPEWADENRTLPWTCLKAGYFWLSESHYLDLGEDKKKFEKAVRENNYENISTIHNILWKCWKSKEWLKFSQLCKISWFGNNIKMTAIVGENGSGKSQILRFLKSKSKEINNNTVFSLSSEIDEIDYESIPHICIEWFHYFDNWIFIWKINEDYSPIVSVLNISQNFWSDEQKQWIRKFVDLIKEWKEYENFVINLIETFILKKKLSNNWESSDLYFSVELSAKKFHKITNILEIIQEFNPIKSEISNQISERRFFEKYQDIYIILIYMFAMNNCMNWNYSS